MGQSLSMVTGQLPQALAIKLTLTADGSGGVTASLVSRSNSGITFSSGDIGTSPLVITLPSGYDCNEMGVSLLVGNTSNTSREPSTVYWNVTRSFVTQASYSIQGVDKNGNVNYKNIVFVAGAFVTIVYQFNPVLV